MKNICIVFISIFFICLNGCNGVGEKDTILARINDEKVYLEDEDLFLINKGGSTNIDRNVYLYDNILGRAALVSRALSEYPSLNEEWEEFYKDVKARIQTIVLQRFFVMDYLTFSEQELRNFYEHNKSNFVKDSVKRFNHSRVAEEYYIYKNKTVWNNYLKNSFEGKKDLTKKDTNDLKKQLIAIVRNDLRDSVTKKVQNDSRIVIHEIPKPSLEDYYNLHKDEFVTIPGYELYQIQMSDSLKLAHLFNDSISLEKFKKLALTHDINEFTSKDSGYVGVVKQDYALPYGIGILSGLKDVLVNKDSGFITPVLFSNSTNNYHRFYLVRNIPSEIKSFERAKNDVSLAIKTKRVISLDSTHVLISCEGKPLFTFADLVRYNRLYFKSSMNVQVIEKILNNVKSTYQYALIAEDNKLENTWVYRALVRETRSDFIVDKYLEKIISVEVSEDSLKSMYEKFGNPIHMGLSFEKSKEDLQSLLKLPINLYKQEYFMGYRVTYSGLTFDESVPKIFFKRGSEYKNWVKNRYMDEAYALSSRHIYDSSIEEHVSEYTPDLLFAKADSLRKAGDLSSSYQVYRKVMNAYATNDSLFQKSLYEMCQVQNDNEEYYDAEAFYYSFYRMWPNSPDAEKAMFTRGFILDENLDKDSVALDVYDEFLKLYPKSELKESVEWLAENIRSKGKLAEDLLKKISEE